MKQPQSFEELVALLRRYRIKYKLWVKGPKTIDDLWAEIEKKEVNLRTKRIKGVVYLVRYATRAQIDIRRYHARGLQILVEGAQRYPNGYVRKRSWEPFVQPVWYRSISEKMFEREIDIEAATRAFLEELGIPSFPRKLLIPCKNEVEDFRRSKSYPGLFDKYNNHRYFCVLPTRFWRDLYQEHHVSGRVTDFTWEFV